jgi:hypothetical protein
MEGIFEVIVRVFVELIGEIIQGVIINEATRGEEKKETCCETRRGKDTGEEHTTRNV